MVDSLNLDNFKKMYRETGRCRYHPKMMLKVIIYAYMNNVYWCRRIEKLLYRDIHYIWLAGYEKPDFITVNRFRNRVKDKINNVFTQLVLILAERGFVTLEVEYIEDTKIESKANKYTFVRRKTEVERSLAVVNDRSRFYNQKVVKTYEVETGPLTWDEASWIDQLFTSYEVMRQVPNDCDEQDPYIGEQVLITDVNPSCLFICKFLHSLNSFLQAF